MMQILRTGFIHPTTELAEKRRLTRYAGKAKEELVK
jgi:hypothetical protein